MERSTQRKSTKSEDFNAETEAEAKPLTKEILRSVHQEKDQFDIMLEKHSYWKGMRITTCVSRFIANCKVSKKNRISGPITTKEVQSQILWWVKRVPGQASETDSVKNDQQRLNLQKNHEEVFECRGRIQGSYPVYLPTNALFTEKLVKDEHVYETLHGGVSLTMTKLRSVYWIPKLRQLVKRFRHNCAGCKRFHAQAFNHPPAGALLIDRTDGTRPFQVIGLDYTCPITYKTKTNREAKAYILLFACSLTIAVYMELVTDMTVEQFMPKLKELVARRGRPEKIYSDNAKTFQAAAAKFKKVMRNEELHDYLARNTIVWQFNLSKAPWWGGQFQRLIGLMKQSLHKVIGRANLKFDDLKQVMLDIESSLNNRPLMYVEDDVQLPKLTPNMMLFGQNAAPVEEDVHLIENKDLRKRARFLEKCKDQLWRRWSTEYLKALREKHNLKHSGRESKISVGDVVLIKGEDRNRGKWSIGNIESLIPGKMALLELQELKQEV